jgi:UDP-GlcNAc:undecaprenyl-phosphate GlcNAc-1-phosphate transferase
MSPYVISVTKQWGLIDTPDDRKNHLKPTPMAGGLILFPLIITALFLSFWGKNYLSHLLLASILIFVIGLYDDFRGAHFSTKFLIQVCAALLVINAGVKINLITLHSSFAYDLKGTSFLSTLVTGLWIVGLTNAVNIIDGVDGLAAGLSLNAFVGICAIGVLSGQQNVALYSCVVAGGIFGFLRYNIYPAKSFLGDSGSMLLGFSIAVISIIMSAKKTTFMVLIIPVLFLAIPMLDTAIAFLRRIGKGDHPFKPDRSHLHHRLQDLNFTPRQILLYFLGFSSLLGIAALSMHDDQNIHGLIWGLVLIALMVGVIKAMNIYNFHDRIKLINLRLMRLSRHDTLILNKGMAIKIVMLTVILISGFNIYLTFLVIDPGRDLILASTAFLLLLAVPDAVIFSRNGTGRIMPFSKTAIFFLLLVMCLGLGIAFGEGISLMRPPMVTASLLLLGILIFLKSPVKLHEIFHIDPLDIISLYMAIFVVHNIHHSFPILPKSILVYAILNSVIFFGIFRIITHAALRTSRVHQPIWALPALFVYSLLWVL